MNIQAILTSLNEKMSDAKIAEAINATQPTVWRLRTGKHKTTFYERAIAIEALALREGVITKDSS